MLKVYLDHELSCQTNSESGISSVKYSIYKGFTTIDVVSMESTNLDNDEVEIFLRKSLAGTESIQVLIDPDPNRVSPIYGDVNKNQEKMPSPSVSIHLKINSESVFERVFGVKDSLVVGLICDRGDEKCLLSINGRNDVQGNFADTTHMLNRGDQITIESTH